MDFLEYVNEHYPVRRNPVEKRAFRTYVQKQAERVSLPVTVEENKKHHNVVVGDVERAKVVFTAHYDTPAASAVPNLMMPRSPFLSYLYAFGYPVGLAMLSLLVAKGAQALFSLSYEVFAVLYIGLYFGVYWLLTRTFPNSNNKNDNTSGVATLLSLMETGVPGAAYIFFDDEEKGLLGSKAYEKAHKETLSDKPVINLDCVGNGKHILTVAKEGAQRHPAYEVFREALVGEGDFSVAHFPKKGSVGNSDYKNFPCGIGVMATKKSRAGVHYTDRIHTAKDTEASAENIEFLRNALVRFSERLTK